LTKTFFSDWIVCVINSPVGNLGKVFIFVMSYFHPTI
jgi:hypothetical protein